MLTHIDIIDITEFSFNQILKYNSNNGIRNGNYHLVRFDSKLK